MSPPDSPGEGLQVLSCTIVIADDSADLRAVMRRSLTRAGASVVGEAEDGDEAVRIAGELRPDVVVMDLVMPGPPAPDLLDALLALPDAPAVVVHSGHAAPELEGRDGVTVVAKSSDPRRLIDGVRQAAAARGHG